MLRYLRITLALGAFFVLSGALAACGSSGGVPGNAVAKIGDDTVNKTDFEHWVSVVAKGAQQQAGQKVVVPDPPGYAKCIANLQKTTPKPAKGKPKPTSAQFRKQCADSYKQIRERAMNFLIQAVWLQGEAKDRNIKITDAEVEKRFAQVKKQNFPQVKQFNAFLKQSGQTIADLKLQVRLDVLSTKLRAQVNKGADKVPQTKVAAYYSKHRKDQFTTPERRDILIILAASEAKAQAALKELKAGTSWKKVAAKYSTDPQTKSSGGLLSDAVEADQDKTFGKQAFAAPAGKLSGPVKSEFGWYVFKVQKVKPTKEQALSEVQGSIRQTLISQQQNTRLSKFVETYQDKWRGRTDCRKGFVITGCKQAPKPKKGQTQQQPQG